MTAAAETTAGGEIDDLFEIAFGFGLTVVIRETDDGVGVADVDV